MPTTIRIADYVLYRFTPDREPDHWRVEHYLKEIVFDFNAWKPKDAIEEITKQVVGADLLEQSLRQQEIGLPHARRVCYEYCTQEQATHLSLAGVCGAIAPIDECTFTHEVEWPQEAIERHRRDAMLFPPLGECTDWLWRD